GTVLHYGQFPFWNPYLGGGNILFHHPEVAVLSPFVLLYFLCGPVVGLKLQVLIAYFLGFWGSLRLFRTLGMPRGSTVVAAVAYFGSVHFALHFAEGHMPFTHYAFLPWFVHFVLKGAEDRRNLLGAVVALALMILGNGAAVPLLYTLLATALLLALRAAQRRSPAEARVFLLAVGLALALAAVKVLPMIAYLAQNRWTGDPAEAIPWSALPAMFFGLKHSLFVQNFAGQKWAWHEYGVYVSPLLVAAGAYAAVARFRRHWPWVVFIAFFLLLGLGNFAPWSPWALLTGLPGFESLRATGRAMHFVILGAAVLGGLGLGCWEDRARAAARGGWLRGAVVAAGLLIAATNLALAWPIMSEGFRKPPKHVDRSPEFRQVVDAEPHAFENYLANRGSLVSPWLSAYHPSRGLVGPGIVYSELFSGGEAKVYVRDYTPNRITYTLNGGGHGGELVIGMGYDPGWRATDGRTITENQGLIAFPVTPGRQTVVLVYRTPYFSHGAVISLLTLGGMVLWRRRLFGRPGRGANL
ncbi:MAG TPA: YfhO family protein, partial [candidate division Zixibacteria bacterium]|nr:YfhO family protein [candidate division Zixibacteria bacterium]